MQCADLLSRFYNITGIDPDDPGSWTESRFYDLANRGVEDLRSFCGDEWTRSHIKAVAQQHTYDFPDDFIRMLRLAWRDITVPPRHMMWLDVEIPDWQTETGEVQGWTQDGLEWNQFRVFRIPMATTDEFYDRSLDPNTPPPDVNTGIILDMEPNVTRVLDANTPPPDTDTGIILDDDEFSRDSDYGIIVDTAQNVTAQFTVWGIKRAETLTNEADEIPVAGPWHLGVLWYVLWKFHEEEREHHNSVLAGMYKDMFEEEKMSMRARTMKPLPRVVHQLRPGDRVLRPSRMPSTMYDPDSGTDYDLIW